VIRALVRRRTLEQSFAFSTALIVILVISATMALVRYRVSTGLVSSLEARGFSVAQSIGAVATPSLLAYNYAALQIAAENAVSDPNLVYVVIHDKEGRPAGVARGMAIRETGLPELPDVHGHTLSRDVRVPDVGGSWVEVLEAVVPVRVEGVDAPWGTVRVGIDYAPVRQELRRVELGLLLLGLLLAAAAVLGGRWMARRVAAPLRTLVEGTEALSSGEMSHRIPVGGPRELAELAQAFNRMMDRLQGKAAESSAYQNQLARLNSTLEQQVRERTRALEESEAQYRTLVEHSPDSILIVQDGRVRFVNRAFEETFGISARRATAFGFRLESIFEGDGGKEVVALLRRWEQGEEPRAHLVQARDSAGALRELELRGSRTEYRGKPAAECLLVDTTEAKRLREELEDTERLRSLGELSSGVAHDFNNLLGAILGRTQLLRAREFDVKTDHELAVIEQAARDGRETVRRIQEFARTRTDQPFVPIDLGGIVRDAVEITRTRWMGEAQRRNVQVEVRVRLEDVKPILGNATELREVFTNLILNSVDALPQGGAVTIGCRDRDGHVEASVADDGVGMTEEIRRHLFDPFFTTKGQAGTGLGMSVAYGIVMRHEGTIDVSSELGRGTRFTLAFPAFEGEMKVIGGDGAAMPQLVRPGRILVIDDEQPIAELLDDALSAEGHAVEIATSGRQGVKMAAGASYDMILTDLGMPDLSGWDVAERIREGTPDVPVVLVTGWGTTISQEEVRRSGVAAVVHKPFEIRELLETATVVLARRLGAADPEAHPDGEPVETAD
jgi:PAS domain S-box-containing protein